MTVLQSVNMAYLHLLRYLCFNLPCSVDFVKVSYILYYTYFQIFKILCNYKFYFPGSFIIYNNTFKNIDLYSMTLLNSLIQQYVCFAGLLGQSMQIILLLENKGSFIFSFPICMTFISFSYFILQTGTLVQCQVEQKG